MSASSPDPTKRVEGIGRLTKGVYVPDDYRTPKSGYCVPAHYEPLIEDIILTRGQIVDRIERLARDIYEHYRGTKEEIVFVVTLKGAVTFFEELSRAVRKLAHNDINSLHRSTYVEEYVKCSSYFGTSRVGAVKVNNDFEKTLDYCRNKHVLIVEDLVDSGNTLKLLYDTFCEPERGVLSVHTVCNFSKRTPIWNGFVPDWVGFDILNEFIVGFGCDVDNHYRDLDHLSTISEEGKKHYL